MIVLDATIVNVALPTCRRALGFTGVGLEWVVTAYSLAFGSLLFRGRLGAPAAAGSSSSASGFFAGALDFVGGFATTEWWLLAARRAPAQRWPPPQLWR